MPGQDDLERWAEARGLDVDLMLGCGFELAPDGRSAILCGYRFSNGEDAPGRVLLLGDGHEGRREWRWEPGGSPKGAVWELGDAGRAWRVLIAEGESDALAAWSVLRDDPHFAILCIPGSSFVPDDLANFIGRDADVTIATDADEAGDRCAARVYDVLAAAGITPIRRLRPDVPHVEHADLRDLIRVLETGQDAAGTLASIIEGSPIIEERQDGTENGTVPSEDAGPEPRIGKTPRHERSPIEEHPWYPTPLGFEAAPVAEAGLWRVEGGGLVYSDAKHHIIAGPASAYKSFLCLLAAAEVLRRGGVVWWWDWEMTDAALIRRALLIGLGPSERGERLLYARPSGSIIADEIRSIVEAGQRPDLVVLDSYTSLLRLFGGDSNSRDAIEQAYGCVLEPLKACGIPSLVTDHESYGAESKGRPTGSPRKAELADVVLMVKRRGGLCVEVTRYKDREHGIFPDFPDGAKLGHFEVMKTPNPVTLVWHPGHVPIYDDDPSRSDYFRPTVLMERVSRWLAGLDEPSSTSEITGGVKGGSSPIRHALHALAVEGYVSRTEGHHGSAMWEYIKPFSRLSDEAAGGAEMRRPDRQDETNSDWLSED